MISLAFNGTIPDALNPSFRFCLAFTNDFTHNCFNNDGKTYIKKTKYVNLLLLTVGLGVTRAQRRKDLRL